MLSTAACSFWFLLWPPDSAPAALTGLLFDWPDIGSIEKTQHFATSLPFCTDVSSFFWLSRYCIFFLLISLLYSVCQLSILSEVRLLNFLRWYTTVYTWVPTVQAFSASLRLRMLRRIMLQLCRTFWTTRTLRKNCTLLFLNVFSATCWNLPDNTRNSIWRKFAIYSANWGLIIRVWSHLACSKKPSTRALWLNISRVWAWTFPMHGHFSNSSMLMEASLPTWNSQFLFKFLNALRKIVFQVCLESRVLGILALRIFDGDFQPLNNRGFSRSGRVFAWLPTFAWASASNGHSQVVVRSTLAHQKPRAVSCLQEAK